MTSAEYMKNYYNDSDHPERREKKRQLDRGYAAANRESARNRAASYYEQNKDKVKAYSRERSKELRMRMRLEAIEKLGGRCMDCEESNPIVLQFHHRPGTIKVAEVTSLATSKQKFWDEVDKCDLVCGNHHLIRHSEGR